MEISLDNIKEAPTRKLVELYNSLTGKSITKFADRKTAEKRLAELLKDVNPSQSTAKEKPKAVNANGKRYSAENRIIQVQEKAKVNPKKTGSLAYKKYEVLLKFDGKSVKEFKEQQGKHVNLDAEAGWATTELRWAVNLGLVKLICTAVEKDKVA